MAKMTYAEQLKHPLWQRKRLDCLQAANWQCQECGDTNTTLHVHHKRYKRGRKAWEYSEEELFVLCEECHGLAHHTEGELNELLSSVNQIEALSLLAGFHCQNYDLNEDLIERARDAYPLNFHIGVAASIIAFLGIHQIAAVAKYAASLTSAKSEARPIFEKWFSGLDKKPEKTTPPRDA